MRNLILNLSSPTHIQIYKTITASNLNPDEDLIRAFNFACGRNQKKRNLLHILREVQLYTVAHPIIFALLILFVDEQDTNKKKKSAKFIYRQANNLAAFIMRTTTVAPKFEYSHFVETFSQIAHRYAQANNPFKIEILHHLQELDSYGVLDDEKFAAKMQEAELKDTRKAKRFLFSLISCAQTDGSLLNEAKSAVEHILPKSVRHLGGWKNFDEKLHKDNYSKIGNFVLLAQNDNKPGDKFNGSFAKKKAVFGRSAVASTRAIAGYPDWSPAAVEQNQKALTALAVKVWAFLGDE